MEQSWQMIAIPNSIELEPLLPGQVHAWLINLEQMQLTGSVNLEWLSKSEYKRMNCYKVNWAKQQFVVARLAMRAILSQYLKCHPSHIEFHYSKKGKPKVAGIEFNLSHSGQLAMLAVASDLPVGIDVEFCKASIKERDLAERFFSENEAKYINEIQQEELRRRAFFRCWTRKEAYIKAIGEGLTHLNRFEVPMSEQCDRLQSHEKGAGEVEKWRIFNLAVPENYHASLVTTQNLDYLRGYQLQSVDVAAFSSELS